jgi:uncharacterized protein YfaS (alpha-2-macroglobulin family)
VLLHHAGKAGGYRGSSAIKGAVDTMVQIQSDNGSNFVTFKGEKSRDAGQTSWAAEAVWDADEFYMRPLEHALQEHYSPAEEYVIRYLTEHGPALVSDIKAGADQCSPEAARTAVYRLVKRGRVSRTNTGTTGEARYETC